MLNSIVYNFALKVLRYDIEPSKIGINEEDGNSDMVIYVTVNVEESPYFTREGMDLSSFIRYIYLKGY